MDYLTRTLVWMIAVYGTALIISMASIFQPIRTWVTYKTHTDQEGVLVSVEREFKLPGKLISCIMCMGFWSGVFWGIVAYSPVDPEYIIFPLDSLFNGVLGCAATWIIHTNLHQKMKGL